MKLHRLYGWGNTDRKHVHNKIYVCMTSSRWVELGKICLETKWWSKRHTWTVLCSKPLSEVAQLEKMSRYRLYRPYFPIFPLFLLRHHWCLKRQQWWQAGSSYAEAVATIQGKCLDLGLIRPDKWMKQISAGWVPGHLRSKIEGLPLYLWLLGSAIQQPQDKEIHLWLQQ